MPRRIRKKHGKKASKKSIVACILASQNLPKIDPTSKKSEKNAFEKKEAMEPKPQTPGRNARQAI
jgi:hypothetical protein